MVMQAAQVVGGALPPDEATARRAIEGNLCRCTGYQKIVDAIVDAGARLAEGKTP
jgi:carbon-monoxide dehydrogenase small subunit